MPHLISHIMHKFLKILRSQLNAHSSRLAARRSQLVACSLLLVACSSLTAQRPVRPRANLLRGPYLQVATSNNIVIRWRTDALVRGIVRYGANQGQLDKTAQDTILVSEHKIKLEGLQPGT